jgi:N-acetylmuramoyl-L-alanine amidase
VVVGSFASKDNSNLMASELQKKGYYTFTTKQKRGGKTFYRVQVGAFSDRDRAEQLRRELEAEGYTARVSTE